jgi:branched-chain amino acid transport system substrate-binding protein
MRLFFRIISLICLPLFFLGLDQSYGDETQLRVAFIGPLSGPAAAVGKAAQNGVILAFEGEEKRSIETFFHDDRFDPKQALSAFSRATSLERVDVVLALGSPSSTAIGPLAERSKIALVAWASDSAVSKGRPNVLRILPSGQLEGNAIGKEMLNGPTALFTSISPYPLSVRSGLLEVLNRDQILLDEQVPPGLIDHRALIARAVARNAKQFFLCLNPGEFGLFAKQSRELGLKPIYFGCGFIRDQNEIHSAGGSLEGARYATVEVAPEFRSRYLKTFGEDNGIATAAAYFDVVMDLKKVDSNFRGPAIISKLIDMPRRVGAISNYKYIKDGDDQFIETPLVMKGIEASKKG